MLFDRKRQSEASFLADKARENFSNFLDDLARQLLASKQKVIPDIKKLADLASATADTIRKKSFSEKLCIQQIQRDLYPQILDIYCKYRKTNWLGRSTRESTLQACSAAIATVSKAEKYKDLSDQNHLPVLMRVPGIKYEQEQKVHIDPFETKKSVTAKKPPKSDNEALILKAISPELFDPIIKNHFYRAIEYGLEMERAGRMYLINCIKVVDPERANAVEYWNSLVRSHFTDEKGALNEAGKLLMFPKSANESEIIANVDKCLALPNLPELILGVQMKTAEYVADEKKQKESLIKMSIARDQDARLHTSPKPDSSPSSEGRSRRKNST